MKWNKNLTAIAASLLLMPGFVKAQWYNRLEVGYSYVMATGQYSGSAGFWDLTNFSVKDTNVTRSIKAKAGAGYDIGFTIPIKRVGRINMWGIGVHFIYNEFIWEGLNQAYTSGGDYLSVQGFPDLYGVTAQLGAPVSIEYKLGPDATCTKRARFGFSLGAGVIPTYNLTALLGVDGAGLGAGFGVNPFVKAEVSVFGGLCFKLRGLISFGDVPYIDQSKNDLAYTSGPFKVTGKTNTMLSFIIMPFAWHWKEEEWYNTYDRYNPYQ